MQARPDPSKHLVARLFYPVPDTPATTSKAAMPYIPHSNYAYGFAAYGTGSLKAWCECPARVCCRRQRGLRVCLP